MGSVDIGDIEAIRLPDHFTLSHSGGSGFNINAIWECPRKAALKLMGWRFKKKPFYFVLGGVVHKEAFVPYLEAGKSVNPAHAREVIAEVVSTELHTEEYVNVKGERKTITSDIDVSDKDRADAPGIIENMLTVWDRRKYNPAQVIACERLVVTDIKDPDTGNAPGICDGIQFALRLDIALNLGHGVGLRDLKSAASALKPGWMADLGYTSQLSSYDYGWAAATGEKLLNLGFFPLVKNKTIAGIEKHATEMILDQSFSWQQIFDAIVTTVAQIKAYEAQGYWPKCHPSGCVGRFGTPCQFAAICFADQMPEGAWEETLVRRDEG